MRLSVETEKPIQSRRLCQTLQLENPTSLKIPRANYVSQRGELRANRALTVTGAGGDGRLGRVRRRQADPNDDCPNSSVPGTAHPSLHPAHAVRRRGGTGGHTLPFNLKGTHTASCLGSQRIAKLSQTGIKGRGSETETITGQ